MSIVSIENAEHYKWGLDSDGWHLLKSDSLSVIQERVPPGESECRHFHNYSQQFFYVLSGVAQLEINGIVHVVVEGKGLHVAAKQPHQLVNAGDVDLVFLVVSEPMSHGDRVDA